MHDIRLVRDDADALKAALKLKGIDADVHRVADMDRSWRELTSEGDNLKAELNKASKAIGMAKREGREATEEMEAARNVRDRIAEVDELKKSTKSAIRDVMLTWPALADEAAPVGKSADDNTIHIDEKGFKSFDYPLLDHLAISEKLGILDMPRGAKITGSGFPLYVGAGATLERALINFMLDLHIREHGYKELFVPFVANDESLLATAQLPKLEDDMYRIGLDELYLIPTAEVPITNMHRDEILAANEVPKKYVAYSACFRREAGAHGSDNRGLLRVHQFNKVELVQICRPEESESVHQEILNNAMKVLDLLDIPYRVLDLCTGDLSFGAARCFDIEVWAPGQNDWLEASSVSNFKDFQSRRMNLRYRAENSKKPEFPYTLNGSGLATSRLMVAILENYQTPEGRVLIPKVLQGYMGGMDQITGENA